METAQGPRITGICHGFVFQISFQVPFKTSGLLVASCGLASSRQIRILYL